MPVNGARDVPVEHGAVVRFEKLRVVRHDEFVLFVPPFCGADATIAVEPLW